MLDEMEKSHLSSSNFIRFSYRGRVGLVPFVLGQYAQKCRRPRVAHTSCTFAAQKLWRCPLQLRLELSQIPKILVPNWECLVFFQI